jgi:predicted translin family RNA/ssDNA-binding protein
VICCVSAAGESLPPFVVSSQVNDKVIETLKIEGFRMGVDMVLEDKQKEYVTATLFHQYVTSVLIPFIERL